MLCFPAPSDLLALCPIAHCFLRNTRYLEDRGSTLSIQVITCYRDYSTTTAMCYSPGCIKRPMPDWTHPEAFYKPNEHYMLSIPSVYSKLHKISFLYCAFILMQHACGTVTQYYGIPTACQQKYYSIT